MANEILKNIKKVIEEKIKEKKIEQTTQDNFGYLSVLLDDAVAKFGEIISNLKIGAPTVNISPPIVNVPEIKIPELKIPEIKVPDVHIPEIKLPIINIPEIKLPDIKIPEIKVPESVVHYTPPAINLPEVKMPDEMNVKGWVQLMGVSVDSPLPVQLRDKDGKPVNLGESSGFIGGGGGHKIVKVSEVLSTVPISAGATLTVDQLSGANWSVTAGSTLDVKQVSGAVWSTITHFSFVNVTSAAATTTVKASAGTLHSVVINSRGTGSTLKLYDNTTDNGNLIATIDTTLSTISFIYDLDFSSGLLAVTAGAGAADLTITYT